MSAPRQLHSGQLLEMLRKRFLHEWGHPHEHDLAQPVFVIEAHGSSDLRFGGRGGKVPSFNEVSGQVAEGWAKVLELKHHCAGRFPFHNFFHMG